PAPAQPPAQPPAPPVAEQPPQPAQPQPAQPPVQPPVQPAQPGGDSGYVPSEPILPGNQHNPIVNEQPIYPSTPSQPAPVQPAPAQPAPVAETPVSPAPVSGPGAPSSIGNGTVSQILYTVKRGDTLSSIAQSELGSWRRWHEIADMNRQVIGTSNNHWIYPGQVLTLPPLNVKPRPTS
ncbi:MAG TPA: LysM domain-containing protein, partial [Candidatus Obscuribacterales bacterium]